MRSAGSNSGYGAERQCTFLTTKNGILHGPGLMSAAGMEPSPSSFAREGPHGPDGRQATQTHLARLCGLDSQCLSHDGAATSNGLQVGHAATTGRGMAGRRREGSERGRRSLLQERAHGLRLTKNCVHDCSFETWEVYAATVFCFW